MQFCVVCTVSGWGEFPQGGSLTEFQGGSLAEFSFATWHCDYHTSKPPHVNRLGYTASIIKTFSLLDESTSTKA